MLSKLESLLKWHERRVLSWMDLLQLEPYHLWWIAFFKGVALVLLLQWLI